MWAMPAVVGAMLSLALLVQEESSPALAFGWNDYPVPRLAKPAVVPGGATGATPKIWIPLPQYLHPFRGKLVLKHKNWDGSSISSFRYSPKENRCEITITRIGSGGIGPQAWMCAYISEIAACNGSPDINGDQRNADGTPLSLGAQFAYTGRLCNRLDIPLLYEQVGGS
jgi:hypothetical protein